MIEIDKELKLTLKTSEGTRVYTKVITLDRDFVTERLEWFLRLSDDVSKLGYLFTVCSYVSDLFKNELDDINIMTSLNIKEFIEEAVRINEEINESSYELYDKNFFSLYAIEGGKKNSNKTTH